MINLNKDELWKNFLEILSTRISDISFNTWFKETKLVDIKDGKLIIQVPMTFHKKYLNDIYYDVIEDIINNITGTNYDLEFVVEEELEKLETNVENNDKIHK